MFTATPKDPFSLTESANFAFIDRDPGPAVPSGMVVAFCRDGSWEPTPVHLFQEGHSVLVDGDPRDQAQVERILGLDVDATSFTDVRVLDPVIKRLQEAAPGLRPPQLHSAYEAVAFCILIARRSATQARRMRADLAHRAGTVLDIAGQPVICPLPSWWAPELGAAVAGPGMTYCPCR